MQDGRELDAADLVGARDEQADDLAAHLVHGDQQGALVVGGQLGEAVRQLVEVSALDRAGHPAGHFDRGGQPCELGGIGGLRGTHASVQP